MITKKHEKSKLQILFPRSINHATNFAVGRYIVGVLVGLVIIAALAVYLLSEAKINATYNAPQVSLPIPSDAKAIKRGRYIVKNISACGDCHGANFEGTFVIDGSALGRVVAPNLTKGKNGLGSIRSDAELMRVLRSDEKKRNPLWSSQTTTGFCIASDVA
jgi:hypothetical protein